MFSKKSDEALPFDNRFGTNKSGPVDYTGTYTSPNGQFDQQLVIALSGLLESFPTLLNYCKKLNVNLFTVLSLPMFSQVDREVGANQDLLSEGVQFLELSSQMSVFYSSGNAISFIDTVIENLCNLRSPGGEVKSIIANETMDEYFVSSRKDLRDTLSHNPFLLGLYLFVLVKTMVGYV